MGYENVTLPDGCVLHVYERGQGGTPLLFVHGNSCDHTFFAPQIEHFGDSRRVAAPDLRGHGASDKPRLDYTCAQLADDMARTVHALGLGPVVAVGHSLGGSICLELARRHPALTAAVACLDTTLLAPLGRPTRIRTLLEGLRSPTWQGYARRYFEAAFEPTDDPARREAILERMLDTPQHVVASLFEHWRGADGEEALRGLEVPLLYVAATRPRTDQERLREACPGALWAQVAGSGHFLTLEVPGQVNAMLERFLALNGLSAG
ncbi:Haloalkane dehalogenase [Fundidesulfovibrio magnetotacticus]|uniref:Haloalkane dehalogenase n=1 Tax=Fundidesulfovibrio magnetotacticus TaxID=2730080 RepID=A0A6V8LZN9_9BACT|nr:alpha/beta hydrolase [Fundidesulfovibrio magnetotacticus]GFK95246.1 Haloalkane dehalogenase [Fundidesulfovibrio magnetotacticus]